MQKLASGCIYSINGELTCSAIHSIGPICRPVDGSVTPARDLPFRPQEFESRFGVMLLGFDIHKMLCSFRKRDKVVIKAYNVAEAASRAWSNLICTVQVVAYLS